MADKIQIGKYSYRCIKDLDCGEAGCFIIGGHYSVRTTPRCSTTYFVNVLSPSARAWVRIGGLTFCDHFASIAQELE